MTRSASNDGGAVDDGGDGSVGGHQGRAWIGAGEGDGFTGHDFAG